MIWTLRHWGARSGHRLRDPEAERDYIGESLIAAAFGWGALGASLALSAI
jgi:hypothetical protein